MCMPKPSGTCCTIPETSLKMSDTTDMSGQFRKLKIVRISVSYHPLQHCISTDNLDVINRNLEQET